MKKLVQEFAMITVGTAIVAVSVYFFMFAGGLTIGSISGVSMVINHFVPIPISVLNFLFNAGLLVLSYFLVGKEFSGKTVYSALLLPVMLGVLEILFPDQPSLTNDPLLDMLCYVFVCGIGLAILFVRNASSGGLDIVAKLLNKYFRVDLGKAMSVTGLVVALGSVLISDAKTVVVSLLGTYISGIVLDHFIFGMNLKRRVCILSPKTEEIKNFILHQLHSGATIYEAYGAYDNSVRREIITIVDKNEYNKLMDFVTKVDPKAFITVISVNEVNYQPKVR